MSLTKMSRTKAVGVRGSWFATVDGKRLPCVHKYWMNGLRYEDPGYVAGVKQWDEYVEALSNGSLAILTRGEWRDEPSNKSGKAVDRTGYIALYKIKAVVADVTSLRFEFIERLQDLK